MVKITDQSCLPQNDVVYLIIFGSRAFGWSDKNSDLDFRAIYAGLSPRGRDFRHDIFFYSLDTFIDCVSYCVSDTVLMLFAREDQMLVNKLAGLEDMRRAFLDNLDKNYFQNYMRYTFHGYLQRYWLRPRGKRPSQIAYKRLLNAMYIDSLPLFFEEFSAVAMDGIPSAPRLFELVGNDIYYEFWYDYTHNLLDPIPFNSWIYQHVLQWHRDYIRDRVRVLNALAAYLSADAPARLARALRSAVQHET